MKSIFGIRERFLVKPKEDEEPPTGMTPETWRILRRLDNIEKRMDDVESDNQKQGNDIISLRSDFNILNANQKDIENTVRSNTAKIKIIETDMHWATEKLKIDVQPRLHELEQAIDRLEARIHYLEELLELPHPTEGEDDEDVVVTPYLRNTILIGEG